VLLCFIYVSDSTLILFVWILSLAVGIFDSRNECVTIRAGLTCDKDKHYYLIWNEWTNGWFHMDPSPT